MPEDSRTFLRKALQSGYVELKARLARRLGSADLAAEALNETWIRLGKAVDAAPVRDPPGYLFRAALNAASNLRRSEARHLGHAEIEDVFALADDAPDPERDALSRDEVARLDTALLELPPRQRDIFRETFANGTPQLELAHRHGISVRTVQYELRDAIAHCADRLKRTPLAAPASPACPNPTEEQ